MINIYCILDDVNIFSDFINSTGIMKSEFVSNEAEARSIAQRFCIHPDVVVVYEVGYNLVKIRRLSLSGPAVKHDNRKVFACYQTANPIPITTSTIKGRKYDNCMMILFTFSSILQKVIIYYISIHLSNKVYLIVANPPPKLFHPIPKTTQVLREEK